MKSRRFIAVVLLIVAITVTAQDEPTLQLRLIGEQRIPTGTIFESTEFGGISALSYDAARERYYALSDDRAEHGFVRYYTLALDFDETAFTGVTIESVVEIQSATGAFEVNGADAESIAYIPDTDTLLWSSERDQNGIPFLREMELNGSFIREFTLPEYYLPAGETRGIASNQGFEALRQTKDGQSVILATESALIQDGGLATLEAGSSNRILILDRTSGTVTAEYLYMTEPIPHSATQPPFAQDNGISELVVLDETTLLVMERSFALGVGNTIHLYAVDLTHATNIAGEETIQNLPEIIPVTKTLVLVLEEGTFGLDIDNLEGMTWGAEINGQATLVLASDNNFNPRQQPYTQFVVLLVE